MACVQLQGGPGNVTGRISRQEMLPALTPAPGLALAVEDAGTAGSAPQHWSPLRPPILQLQTSSCIPVFPSIRSFPAANRENSLRMSPPGWLIAPDKLRWLLYRALAPAASLSASSITLSAHPDPQLQIPLPTTGDTWRGLPAQATATGKELSIHSPERGTAAAGRWPQAKDFTGI